MIPFKLTPYTFIAFLWFFILLGYPAQAHHDPKSPSGTFELDWQNGQITHTYAVGIFQTMGLRVDNDPSRAGVRIENGESILYGIALSFDLNDDFAFDGDQKVKVKIELDVTNLPHFYITYDKNGSLDAVKKVNVEAGSSGWQEFEIELNRARFANRGFGGTDFAIASNIDMSNTLLFIKNIKFELIGKSPLPAKLGNIQLRIQKKGTNELIAAQIGLYDESGRMPLPSHHAVELQVFEEMTRNIEIREELDQLNWPHPNHYSMYADGFYSANIPAGKYTLVIMKGPEYAIEVKKIDILPNTVNPVIVEMEHVLDMPSKGWYSGDVHNHLSRENSQLNVNQIAHAKAADLHMHWLYALGNSVNTYFHQYAWGEEGQYREKNYFLGSGQEDPRTDFLGHVLAMGHNEFIRYPNKYLHYDEVSKEVHNQGGIFGIAHMDFAQFQQKIALALLAPQGEIDFVEILQYHALHLEDWYAFLNLGFKLPAAAGSDWPYMSLPGSVRTYVKVNDSFTPKSWNENLKAGKSFVTNGPMIDFHIAKKEMGSTIAAKVGDTLHVEGEAYIHESLDKLNYMAIILNGDVVKEIQPDQPGETIKLGYQLEVKESCWVALLVKGEKTQEIIFQTQYTKQTQAHSSPIYISVDNKPSWSTEKAPMIIDQLISRMEEVKEMPYQRNDNEAWESPDRTAELLENFRPRLRNWIDETILYYQTRKKEILD